MPVGEVGDHAAVQTGGPNVYGGFRRGSLPIPRKVTAVCLVASSCSTQHTGRLPSKRERNASTLVGSKIKALQQDRGTCRRALTLRTRSRESWSFGLNREGAHGKDVGDD